MRRKTYRQNGARYRNDDRSGSSFAMSAGRMRRHSGMFGTGFGIVRADFGRYPFMLRTGDFRGLQSGVTHHAMTARARMFGARQCKLKNTILSLFLASFENTRYKRSGCLDGFSI